MPSLVYCLPITCLFSTMSKLSFIGRQILLHDTKPTSKGKKTKFFHRLSFMEEVQVIIHYNWCNYWSPISKYRSLTIEKWFNSEVLRKKIFITFKYLIKLFSWIKHLSTKLLIKIHSQVCYKNMQHRNSTSSLVDSPEI